MKGGESRLSCFRAFRVRMHPHNDVQFDSVLT